MNGGFSAESLAQDDPSTFRRNPERPDPRHGLGPSRGVACRRLARREHDDPQNDKACANYVLAGPQLAQEKYRK